MNDAAGGTRKDVYPIGKKNPNLPFHPAVRAGDFIFVSGQVAKDADGNMISGTIEDETRGTIESAVRTSPPERKLQSASGQDQPVKPSRQELMLRPVRWFPS